MSGDITSIQSLGDWRVTVLVSRSKVTKETPAAPVAHQAIIKDFLTVAGRAGFDTDARSAAQEKKKKRKRDEETQAADAMSRSSVQAGSHHLHQWTDALLRRGH